MSIRSQGFDSLTGRLTGVVNDCILKYMQVNEKGEKYYKIKDIAGILKLNKITVWRHIRQGKIKALKAGRDYRVSEADFQEYLKNQKVQIV